MRWRFDLQAANTSKNTWPIGPLNSGWSPAARGFTPPRVAHSQAYFWAREWQAAEREVQRELDAGRSITFTSAEDAFNWLDAEGDA
jgi:hypothetical protein